MCGTDLEKFVKVGTHSDVGEVDIQRVSEVNNRSAGQTIGTLRGVQQKSE